MNTNYRINKLPPPELDNSDGGIIRWVINKPKCSLR